MISLIEDGNFFASKISGALCLITTPFHSCEDQARTSFLHSIQLIEAHIHVLGEYNITTDRSLIFLEQHICAISDLIGNESHELSQEIGELLRHLWT